MNQLNNTIRSVTMSMIFMAASSLASANQDSILSAKEQQAIDGLKEKGITEVYLLNEQAAILKYVKNGEIIMTAPAISGKHKGDTITDHKEATPAGIFELRAYLNGEDIQYYRVGREAYLIHETGPIRRKLLSKRGTIPSDSFRVSSGCINIVPSDFRQIYNNVANAQKASFLFVMPEKEMDMDKALQSFHLEND
ncbi:MAG: L,D-transpeptidase [Alphaproteobacteria bacterium]|nr:L,D-transpeptidase [Alphaproteobacteria bacterium]